MLKYRKDELDPTKKMFLKKSNVLKNKKQIFLKCFGKINSTRIY